jgi:hypothetical protein
MPVALAVRYVAVPKTCEPQLACEGLRATHSTFVDRANHGPKHLSEGPVRIVLDDVAQALLVRASGTRVTHTKSREAWIASCVFVPVEVHLGCCLAKGSTVGRTGMPSAGAESIRERRVGPSCAPESRPHHAASAEALLWSARAFFTVCEAPASDEKSA